MNDKRVFGYHEKFDYRGLPEQKKFESMTWEQWVLWIIKIIEDIIDNLPPEIAKKVRKGISHEIHD